MSDVRATTSAKGEWVFPVDRNHILLMCLAYLERDYENAESFSPSLWVLTRHSPKKKPVEVNDTKEYGKLFFKQLAKTLS